MVHKSIPIEMGFSKLNFSFPRKKTLKLFRLFNRVCELFDENYPHHFALLDGHIDDFIKQSQTPLANETLKFKNLTVDSLKYKHRTNEDYQIYSYQYLEGLEEFIDRRLDEKIAFLREMRSCHSFIKRKLHPLIESIEKKVSTSTLLKIWRHSPIESNPFFLPVHYDRSIFTIIVHTENEGEECLRIYPPTQEMELEQIARTKAPYIPQQTDFPLLFPGIHAKLPFSLEPTPHSVVADSHSTRRYSLVFFIARFSGW